MMALWAALAPLQPLAPEPPPELPPEPLALLPLAQSLLRLELRETADSCIVTVVAPGYDTAGLEVQATANSLTIASRQASDRSPTAALEAFRQTLALPQPVQPGLLQVALQGETMVVSLPKLQPKQRWTQCLLRSLRQRRR